MKKISPFQVLKDERGIITFDFIFAFVMVWGFTSILFALTLTLSVVEISQYVSFSTARTFHAAHWSPELQNEIGEEKYSQLINNPVLSPLFNNGWFTISQNAGLGDWNELYPQSQDPRDNEGDSDNFIGSRLTLNAKILEIQIPLIGLTYDDSDAFTANVASYLNREPTSEECLEFGSEDNRFRALKRLDATYNRSEVKNYVHFADNGC